MWGYTKAVYGIATSIVRAEPPNITLFASKDNLKHVRAHVEDPRFALPHDHRNPIRIIYLDVDVSQGFDVLFTTLRIFLPPYKALQKPALEMRHNADGLRKACRLLPYSFDCRYRF